MKNISFWSQKLTRRAIQFVGGHLYVNPDPELSRSILVAGTARSGTTWLGDLIAMQIPCRTMFEPFNPNLVPQYRSFQYFQYMRPGTTNKDFYSFSESIFRGTIRNAWIDRQNERMFATHRLIKEIRINLALKWLHDQFPVVPIVFLLRHPCAVVQSRLELGWATDEDIQPFLAQPKLVEDHLAPYLDLIHGAHTDEEKHAIIWSVSQLVPLRQLQAGDVHTVYYEDLCTQPDAELTNIFSRLGLPYQSMSASQLNRPSQTTVQGSAVVSGTSKLGFWKKKLTSSQIDNILRVVDAFGLSTLYGDSETPLASAPRG